MIKQARFSFSGLIGVDRFNRVQKGLQGQKKGNFRETATDVDVLKKKLIESQETRELYKNECETSGLTIEKKENVP